MQLDALILDVDGTLWNSTGIVAKAWTRAVKEGGGSREITAEMLQEQFGKTMKVIADNLLPDMEPERRYAIMDVCCVYEHEALEEDPCHICYPGVIDTIKELSRRTKLMIVSNCQSGYIELFLRKTGLESCITDTECYGDTGKNKDENIRLVAERNGLKHPVYVGDTQGDCDAAAKAGVPFVFASYGFGQADRADVVIRSFDELLELTQAKPERSGMKRILWMVLMNLWYVPYGIARLLRMAAHPESYTLEERYALIKQIDNRAIKGGRVEIEGHGLENLPREDGYILYPNHQGMFDVLAILQLMKRPTSVVLKKELENIPFLKQVIACLGALPIDRKDPRQGMKVILQVTKEVMEGKNFIIFAEGTRSKNGNELLDFKGGSFKCAVKSKCPIVPVALIDSYKAFDTGSIAKTKVQVHFLEPIYFDEYEKLKTTEIAALVKERIEACIRQCTNTQHIDAQM